ncbi:hypothetical protein K8I61_11400 [bacterium]|nr:hypothetical protein [bacterium]
MRRGVVALLLVIVPSLAIALAPRLAWAQNVENFGFDASKPINLASDRLEVDNKTQTARFIGNVVAVQGDVMMNADMVTIVYDRSKPAAASAPSEGAAGGLSALTGGDVTVASITAAGRVVLVQNERRFTGDQIVFDQKTQTVVMTGSPNFVSGEDALEGSRIVIHLDTERVEVIGSPNRRVRITVIPRDVKNELPDRARPRAEQLRTQPPPTDPPADSGSADDQ